MPIVDPAVERYALEHSTPEPGLLAAVAETTRTGTEAPEMMVGPVEGALLATLVALARPRLVLEVGTFTGYSALAMAAALPEGARVLTCEVDPTHAEIARKHVSASPYSERIEVRLGPALETIAGLEEPVDLAFVDADKTGYPDYYEAILPRLSDRGLMAIDNTLRDGSVLEPDRSNAADVAVAALNDRIRDDPRVRAVLLTVRDGLTLVRRRGA